MTTQIDLLTGNKWSVFATEEPKGRLRRRFEIDFNGGKLNFRQTTLFSEAGLGPDLTLEIEADIFNLVTMNDGGTFTVDKGYNQSGANDLGHQDSLFLNPGTKPFVVHWGNRRCTMFRRVWQRKEP